MIPAFSGWQYARIIGHIKRFEKHEDPFIDFCQLYEGEVIFLTLKSKKIYAGILVEYPESTSQHPQHILILPIWSGYRTTSGEAKWTTIYPDVEKDDFFNNIKLLISKDEIVTMTPWKEFVDADFKEFKKSSRNLFDPHSYS